MTKAVERLRQEVSLLPYDEREALVRTLELDLAATTAGEEDPSEIESAWDEEIASRIREIEEGRVHPLSAEESELRLDALFLKHGIERTHE